MSNIIPPPMLRKPEVQYPVHNSPKPVPIRSQLNPVHILSPYCSCNIYFNIVTSFTYTSIKWSLFFRFTRQIRVCISLTRATYPTHHTFLVDLPNNIRWEVQTKKCFFTQISPISAYFIPTRLQYLPHQNPQLILSLISNYFSHPCEIALPY